MKKWITTLLCSLALLVGLAVPQRAHATATYNQYFFGDQTVPDFGSEEDGNTDEEEVCNPECFIVVCEAVATVTSVSALGHTVSGTYKASINTASLPNFTSAQPATINYTIWYGPAYRVCGGGRTVAYQIKTNIEVAWARSANGNNLAGTTPNCPGGLPVPPNQKLCSYNAEAWCNNVPSGYFPDLDPLTIVWNYPVIPNTTQQPYVWDEEELMVQVGCLCTENWEQLGSLIINASYLFRKPLAINCTFQGNTPPPNPVSNGGKLSP
jgi:hypothetical protein